MSHDADDGYTSSGEAKLKLKLFHGGSQRFFESKPHAKENSWLAKKIDDNAERLESEVQPLSTTVKSISNQLATVSNSLRRMEAKLFANVARPRDKTKLPPTPNVANVSGRFQFLYEGFTRLSKEQSAMETKIDSVAVNLDTKFESLSTTLVRMEAKMFNDGATRKAPDSSNAHTQAQVPLSAWESNRENTQLGYRFGSVSQFSPEMNQAKPILKVWELPAFDGQNADAWVDLVERTFNIERYTEIERLGWASFNLTGTFERWYKRERVSGTVRSWSDFKNRLLAQFGNRSVQPISERMPQKESIPDFDQEEVSDEKQDSIHRVEDVNRFQSQSSLLLNAPSSESLSNKEPICETELVQQSDSPIVEDISVKYGEKVSPLMHMSRFDDLVSWEERNITPSLIVTVISNEKSVGTFQNGVSQLCCAHFFLAPKLRAASETKQRKLPFMNWKLCLHSTDLQQVTSSDIQYQVKHRWRLKQLQPVFDLQCCREQYVSENCFPMFSLAKRILLQVNHTLLDIWWNNMRLVISLTRFWPSVTISGIVLLGLDPSLLYWAAAVYSEEAVPMGIKHINVQQEKELMQFQDSRALGKGQQILSSYQHISVLSKAPYAEEEDRIENINTKKYKYKQRKLQNMEYCAVWHCWKNKQLYSLSFKHWVVQTSLHNLIQGRDVLGRDFVLLFSLTSLRASFF